MTGPEVSWYLAVAACLFATGALGVLLRRSPLIVLLSLEIMLNGANLALIAFARHQGDETGQIFALAVMAVAASEVVVAVHVADRVGDDQEPDPGDDQHHEDAQRVDQDPQADVECPRVQPLPGGRSVGTLVGRLGPELGEHDDRRGERAEHRSRREVAGAAP